LEFAVKTILKTNDPVLLSFAKSLLDDAGIGAAIFDDAMSVMDGSLGILPRRLVVSDEEEAAARALLKDGVGAAQLEPE
jgi:hypothetical protein